MKTSAPAAAHLVRIRWLTYACFEIQAKGVSVVIDPFIGKSPYIDETAECVQDANYILLSHAHWDHVTDIKYLMDKFGASLLCGQLTADPMSRWLDCNPSKVYPMNPGLEVDFGAAKIKAQFGRHSDLKMNALKCNAYVEKRGVDMAGITGEGSTEMARYGTLEYTNFLITLKNGVKILTCGRVDLPEAQEMIRGIKPDILLAQFTTKNTEAYAEHISNTGAKFIIPHHMDHTWPEEEYKALLSRVAELLEEKGSDSILLIPNHGEWYDFSMGVSCGQTP